MRAKFWGKSGESGKYLESAAIREDRGGADRQKTVGGSLGRWSKRDKSPGVAQVISPLWIAGLDRYLHFLFALGRDPGHRPAAMASTPVHHPQRLVAMKNLLLLILTWWNGQTFGTMVWTRLYGEFVGEDEFGNKYYRTKGGKIDPGLGFQRRWVIYNGYAEASMIGATWHGWLHNTVDTPPTEQDVKPRPWWKPHRPNLTGTPGAYRPKGSLLAQGRRPRATGDYKAWTPDR